MENQRLKDAISRISTIVRMNIQTSTFVIDRLKSLNQCLRNPPSESNFTRNAFDGGIEQARNQNEIERKRVDERLRGFSVKTSEGWKTICDFYGPSLNQAELLSLAEVIALQLNLKVDREAKRRKEVLIKWFDENIETIKPILPLVKLEDSEGRPVTGNLALAHV